MNSKIALLAELCAITGAQSPETRTAIWDCLGRYNVQSTAAASGFDASLAAFLSAKRVDGLSRRTLGNYRQTLAAFGNLVPKPPALVTPDDVRGYLSALEGRGLKKSSILTHANTLRSFFSWLVAEEQLERSPMGKIKSPRLDRRHSRQPLSAPELERARRACGTERDRALLELLVSTGCRVSELRNVRLADVDMQLRSFEVVGKGAKTRRVYFSPRAAAALEEYFESRPSSPFLFPCGVRAVQRAMQRLGQRARLKTPLYPHKLRHTFASHAINHGMAAAVLQQLLGHESMDTTQIYAKLSTATIARAYHKAVA